MVSPMGLGSPVSPTHVSLEATLSGTRGNGDSTACTRHLSGLSAAEQAALLGNVSSHADEPDAAARTVAHMAADSDAPNGASGSVEGGDGDGNAPPATLKRNRKTGGVKAGACRRASVSERRRFRRTTAAAPVVAAPAGEDEQGQPAHGPAGVDDHGPDRTEQEMGDQS